MQTSTVDGGKNLPAWLNESQFFAKTTIWEKINRIVNNFIFAFAIGGYYLKPLFSKKVEVFHNITLLLAFRKTLHVIAGSIIYKAPYLDKTQLKQAEKEAHKNLIDSGCIVKKITLNRSGVAFAATLIAKPETLDNGCWSIESLGINRAMENELEFLAKKNFALGFNTLVSNGPGVGQSEGFSTCHNFCAGYESLIQYAETIPGDNKVLLYSGHSFGGGVSLESINRHDFEDKKINHIASSNRTFSTLIEIVAETVQRNWHTYLSNYIDNHLGKVISHLFSLGIRILFPLIGFDLDCISASKRLADRGIEHIILQSKNNHDSIVFDKVSLATALVANDIYQNKTILEEEVEHSKPLTKIQNEYNDKIRLLVSNFYQKNR